MTPEEFEAEMRRLAAERDIEEGHARMDDLMVKVLRTLGYGAGCDVYIETDRWYA